MKLLFIVEHFSLAGSGAENDAVNLCLALVERGHQIRVVCKTGDLFDGIALDDRFDLFDEAVREFRPDVTVDWGLFASADIHRLGGGAHKSFLKYYLQAFPKFQRPFKKLGFFASKHRRQIAAEKQLFARQNAHFLAISDFVNRQACEQGADPSQVTTLYNGVDLNRFCPDTPQHRYQIRKEWGLAEDDIAGLFVAHNLRLKNFRLLIRVYDELTKKYPQLKLVVCGKRAPAVSRPYLIYAGFSREIEKFYRASDLYLHPSFFDAFGNVVLEAMACQLPVLVSHTSGACELLTGELQAFILPPDEDAAWKEKLIELVDDKARERVGKLGLDIAQKHRFEAFVTGFEEILQKVQNNKP